jgi:3-dehydroquinate synthase class II
VKSDDKFVKYSLGLIAQKLHDDKDTVIRVESASGAPKAFKIMEVGDDWLVVKDRDGVIDHLNFNLVQSWRFAEHKASEWRG